MLSLFIDRSSSLGPLVLSALLSAVVLAEDQPEPDSIDRDYRSELRRIQPLESQEALTAFTVSQGFRMELIVDPIVMAFDERGRLFVVWKRATIDEFLSMGSGQPNPWLEWHRGGQVTKVNSEAETESSI